MDQDNIVHAVTGRFLLDALGHQVQALADKMRDIDPEAGAFVDTWWDHVENTTPQTGVSSPMMVSPSADVYHLIVSRVASERAGHQIFHRVVSYESVKNLRRKSKQNQTHPWYGCKVIAEKQDNDKWAVYVDATRKGD